MGYMNDTCLITVRTGVLVYIEQEQVVTSVPVFSACA